MAEDYSVQTGPRRMLRIGVFPKNEIFPRHGFVKMSFFAIEMAKRIG
jgi:hypothetical protein